MRVEENFEISTELNRQTDFRVSHQLNEMSISTLTPMEIDFFFAFVSDIQQDDDNLKRYTISKKMIEQKMQRRIDKNRIAALLKKMLGKQIWIRNSEEIIGYNIFATLGCNTKTEEYNVLFNPDLRPFLLNLETFILGNTKYLFALESKYQKQLYLLLSKWKRNGVYVTKFDALLENMKIEGTMREFKNFKRRVLESSRLAFEKKSDIVFEWEITQKQGKKAVEITFYIKPNPLFRSEQEAKEVPQYREKKEGGKAPADTPQSEDEEIDMSIVEAW